jgi:hypothetical protein
MFYYSIVNTTCSIVKTEKTDAGNMRGSFMASKVLKQYFNFKHLFEGLFILKHIITELDYFLPK